MRRTHLIALLAAVAAIGVLAADASAYYHPGLGRFLSRDPGPAESGPVRVGARGPAVRSGFAPRDNYAEGMNVYQYVAGRPCCYVDPTGRWKINVDPDCNCPCPANKPQSGIGVKSNDIKGYAEIVCDQIRNARQRWQAKVIAPIAEGMCPGLAEDNVRLAQRIAGTLQKMEDRCNSGIDIECETGGGLKGFFNSLVCANPVTTGVRAPRLFASDKIVVCKCNHRPTTRLFTHELSHMAGTKDPYLRQPFSGIGQWTKPSENAYWYEEIIEDMGSGPPDTVDPWGIFADPADINAPKPPSYYGF